MSDEIERCILVKNEVFVYKIPPRASARGYRAADWNLSAPDWTGRLRLITGGKVNFKWKNIYFLHYILKSVTIALKFIILFIFSIRSEVAKLVNCV